MSEQPTPKQAIHSLYQLYSNDVYRYARMMLGSSSDAYDAVQEVFLRAFRSWNTYRQDASAKTWLMSITRNYISDVRRKKRSESKYVSQHEPPEVADQAKPIEVILEVEDALRQLKATYRQVIILRHLENLSIEETANVLGWSPAKVRTTSHRAMTKLREILATNPREVNVQHEIGTRNS